MRVEEEEGETESEGEGKRRTWCLGSEFELWQQQYEDL